MTTQTLTSNPAAPFDEAALNRLAGEFFARLPGAPAAAPSGALAPVAPALAGAAATPGVPAAAPSPRLSAAPHGAPAAAAAPPAAQPQPGTPAHGYAAALPQAAAPAPAAAPSPYYFVSEANGYPRRAPELDTLAQQAVRPDELLSHDELVALVRSVPIVQPTAPATTPAGAASVEAQ